MTKTRIATFDDIDLCVGLAKRFHERNDNLSMFKFSPSGSRNYMAALMASPQSVIITDGYGFIGASVSDYPFCDVRIAEEHFWYADSANADGVALLRAYHKWSYKMKADINLVKLIKLDGQDMSRIERFMSLMGYEQGQFAHIRIGS